LLWSQKAKFKSSSPLTKDISPSWDSVNSSEKTHLQFQKPTGGNGLLFLCPEFEGSLNKKGPRKNKIDYCSKYTLVYLYVRFK
jgi:hypothetical protein